MCRPEPVEGSKGVALSMPKGSVLSMPKDCILNSCCGIAASGFPYTWLGKGWKVLGEKNLHSRRPLRLWYAYAAPDLLSLKAGFSVNIWYAGWSFIVLISPFIEWCTVDLYNCIVVVYGQFNQVNQVNIAVKKVNHQISQVCV